MRSGAHRGEVTWWRRDGSLVCRSHFDDEGRLDGVATRFHPDGTVSMESRYVQGTRWGKTLHTRSRSGRSLAGVPDYLEGVHDWDSRGALELVVRRGTKHVTVSL